jgi:hypothetical protein
MDATEDGRGVTCSVDAAGELRRLTASAGPARFALTRLFEMKPRASAIPPV